MNAMDGPSRTQDEWIALRCQAGEQNAFEDLVALMERPLLYYATKLTGNAETALGGRPACMGGAFGRGGRGNVGRCAI